MSATVLEARDVSVRFGGLRALSNVGITVPSRTIVGLVGPNGAGKTTLFGVFSGLQRAERGVVMLRGVDISRRSPQARALSGLARSFQQSQLFRGLTVRENLILAYRVNQASGSLKQTILGRRERRSDEATFVDDLLERLRIASIGNKDVDGLPLGLCRLVEVGRALAGSPAVVLLDEPFAGLDRSSRDRLTGVLAQVPRAFGTSVVIVEHDVEIVLELSETVYVLDFGKVIAEGAPSSIRRSAIVRAAYLGEPSPSEAAKTKEIVNLAIDNESGRSESY